MAILKVVMVLLAMVHADLSIGNMYHTSEEVDAELKKLEQNCDGMTVHEHKGPKGEATLTSVSMKPTSDADSTLKVLLFFGEHSRELISVESGLSLVRNLCGLGSEGVPESLIGYSRKNAEFLIFTNIGVNSRRKVEQGQYCTRVNENGVDLNRNWDDHWKPNGQGDEYPGTAAFTEDETHILKEKSDAFRPDLFLTVHSGTLGMYIPYAFSRDAVEGKSTAPMLRILNEMNPEFCNCDVGAAGKEVGYLCPGTCLDYLYDLGTKYSFAFEIYETGQYKRPPTGLAPTDGFGSCMLQKEASVHHSHSHHHGVLPMNFKDPNSKRSLLTSRKERLRKKIQTALGEINYRYPEPSNDQGNFCMRSFNPITQEQYSGANKNWVSAYLHLVKEVNEHHIKTGF